MSLHAYVDVYVLCVCIVNHGHGYTTHALAGMSIFTKKKLSENPILQNTNRLSLQRSNDKHTNMVTKMEEDALRNKNSNRHISKGNRMGSRRRYKKIWFVTKMIYAWELLMKMN